MCLWYMKNFKLLKLNRNKRATSINQTSMNQSLYELERAQIKIDTNQNWHEP
jgi:hypothetical protein